MKNICLKIIVSILILSFAVSLFSSCESQPLKSDKKSLTVVGKVGDYEVKYEELYFLVHSYRDQLDLEYGENASVSSEMVTVKDKDGNDKTVKLSEHYYAKLTELVYENIVSNYAVLTLANASGLTLDSEMLQSNIQITLDSYIESDFAGDRGAYKDYLREQGLTDSYVRFSIGVDHLYSSLTAEYLRTGVLSDDEAYIKDKINNEFVRTWHIMILNEDRSEANYQKAEEALDKINSGTSMYKMIGSKYNEDFLLTDLDGYYFTKGIMDEAYEKAAYDLEIGEISGIVASVGKNASGSSVDCYYIIQRLELEGDYIETHYETLKNDYYTSIVYGMVNELQSSLRFVPNEYCSSLDLLSLEAPQETDPVIIIVISSIAAGVAACTAVVVLIVIKLKKNKEKILRLAAQNNSAKKNK